MLKLNFAHICEKAFLSQDGKINIIGDFDRIKVMPLEQGKLLVRFTVVTNFSGPIGDYQQEIKIVQQGKSNFVSKVQSTLKIQDKKAGSIVEFGLLLSDYGEYDIKILVDRNEYIAMPLLVEKL